MEPAKGNEFCRVGVVCHLHLSISNAVTESDDAEVRSVMYEVLAEQSVWAVCGRTAGVICFSGASGKNKNVALISLSIDSLVLFR